MRLMEKHEKTTKGEWSKGPASQSAWHSLKSLALTILGFCCTETRLLAKNDT